MAKVSSAIYKQILGNDYDAYVRNKGIYETAPNSEGVKNAAISNEALREYYGITEDNASYSDLAVNPYKSAQESYLSKISKTGMSDPYAREREAAYSALKNFSYDPSSDPAYLAYKDQFARESDSAQKQTMANLTALSGGRNNSWASAATAQVGQAYAKQTTDMIPQLAQQAYNTLLQRYNLAGDMSDRAYSRSADQYNRNVNLASIYGNLAQQHQNDMRYDDETAYSRGVYADETTYNRKEREDEKVYTRELEARAQVLEDKKNALFFAQQRGYFLPEEAALLGVPLGASPYAGDVERQNQMQVQTSSGGSGAAYSGSVSSGNSSPISGMNKTEIKDWAKYHFSGSDGKLNKSQLLQTLAYGSYPDDVANAIISAAGITESEINQWQRDAVANVRNMMTKPRATLPYDPDNILGLVR